MIITLRIIFVQCRILEIRKFTKYGTLCYCHTQHQVIKQLYNPEKTSTTECNALPLDFILEEVSNWKTNFVLFAQNY